MSVVPSDESKDSWERGMLAATVAAAAAVGLAEITAAAAAAARCCGVVEVRSSAEATTKIGSFIGKGESRRIVKCQET